MTATEQEMDPPHLLREAELALAQAAYRRALDLLKRVEASTSLSSDQREVLQRKQRRIESERHAERRSPRQLFHVLPLYRFIHIVRTGGILCGRDAEEAGFSRRASSRDQDDRALAALDGLAPADCVLLFRRSHPPLLDDKLRGRGTPKAYPHIQISIPAWSVLDAADGDAYGSTENVGRCLRRGGTPQIARVRRVRDIGTAMEELLVPAKSLPERRLRLGELALVEAYSEADAALCTQVIQAHGCGIPVRITPRDYYVAAQRAGRGREFLEWSRQYTTAVLAGDDKTATEFVRRIEASCYD